MLLNEQIRTKELPSLIDALCEHIKENGYSEHTIRKVRNTLKRFCRFADENNVEVYDSFSVQSFIVFNHGDDYQDKYYSYSITRPFSMLDDYLRLGTVIRQKYSNGAFAEEFEPLFQAFLNHLEHRNYAASSIKVCHSHLLRFQHFLLSNNIHTLNKLTTDDVKNYCSSLASYSTTSSCQIIRELRQMFMFAKINGYLEEDPSVTMPHVKNTRSQRLLDIFTSEEINKILEVIDRNDPLGKRDYAIVITTVRLGLRSCDVISLKFSAVDWAKKEIHIVQKKTGVPLTLPLPDDVGWAIIDYIKNARPDSRSDSIFVGFNPPYDGERYCISAIERNFRDVLSAAKIPYGGKLIGSRIHDLRHTFACHQLYKWAKDGTDLMVMLPVLSKYLGHTGVLSTQWYLRLTAEAYPDITEKMEQFSDKLFPEIGGELLEEAD